MEQHLLLLELTGDCIFLYLLISSTSVTFEKGIGWYSSWQAPNSGCEIYGARGPFSVCKRSVPLTCSCLNGFVPKTPDGWSKGNWTGGCVRRTQLNCERNSITAVAAQQKGKVDGFLKMFTSGGQDLFLRLAHSELGEEKAVTLIVSLTAISTFIISSTIVYSLHRRRACQKVNESVQRMWRNHLEAQGSLELPVYDLDNIILATNNFSLTNKLGQGGYGPVYKGKLQDGMEVAIKRLSSSSGQGVEEFKNEIVLISKLQHRNLVKLHGSKANAKLDWHKRFNVVLGVAPGVLYFHRDSRLRIIHRHLKASNILLDENMNPKISDFGLARIFQRKQDLANTRRVVGTFFGVLLLEIISGKRINSFIYNEDHLGLLAYAWQSWNENRGLSMVDDALSGSFSSSEAIRYVNIGLLCVQDKAADMPNMQAVVSMLSGETKLPQPKEPTFLFQTTFNCHVHSENQHALSINEVTESIIQRA
ncbi:conserved hypothetical protein, partial [Ricinus communis]